MIITITDDDGSVVSISEIQGESTNVPFGLDNIEQALEDAGFIQDIGGGVWRDRSVTALIEDLEITLVANPGIRIG